MVKQATKRTHAHADRPNAVDDIEEETKKINPKKLAVVIDLARKQLKLAKWVVLAEEDLKKAKSELNTNMTATLPKAMADADITDSVPLGGGAVVELDTIVTASIPSPYGKAENAVERNALGIAVMNKAAPSLVVNTATITFAKGQEKLLKKLINNLGKYKPAMEVVVESTVHAATLKKWVAEQDKAGKTVDEEALNVHRIKVAKVVLAKKKKDKV